MIVSTLTTVPIGCPLSSLCLFVDLSPKPNIVFTGLSLNYLNIIACCYKKVNICITLHDSMIMDKRKSTL